MTHSCFIFQFFFFFFLRRKSRWKPRGGSYIFSVRTDIVGRLRVVGAFCEPLPDGRAVCGCVVHLTAFKTKNDEKQRREIQH